jgi:hypothetical protein
MEFVWKTNYLLFNVTEIFFHRLFMGFVWKANYLLELLGFWTLSIVGNFYILENTRIPRTTRIPDYGLSPETQQFSLLYTIARIVTNKDRNVVYNEACS